MNYIRAYIFVYYTDIFFVASSTSPLVFWLYLPCTWAHEVEFSSNSKETAFELTNSCFTTNQACCYNCAPVYYRLVGLMFSQKVTDTLVIIVREILIYSYTGIVKLRSNTADVLATARERQRQGNIDWFMCMYWDTASALRRRHKRDTDCVTIHRRCVHFWTIAVQYKNNKSAINLWVANLVLNLVHLINPERSN